MDNMTSSVPWVVCDLDGTLLSVNSFTKFTAWLGFRYPRLLVPLAWVVLRRKLRLISHAEAKREIVAMAAKCVDREKLGVWIRRLLELYINTEVQEILRNRSEDGCCLLLATAAPELYAVALGREAGFDAVLATPAPGPENRREEKRDRIAQFMRERGGRPVLFISDHDDDMPTARWVESRGGRTHWITR